MEGVRTEMQAVVDGGFVERFLAARVTEEESLKFALQSAEVIAFTLLMIQARIGDRQTEAGPNTLSSAIPPYEKPAPKPKPRSYLINQTLCFL